MPQSKRLKQEQDEQSRRFIEKARELGCDDDEAKFIKTVKKIAAHKPVAKKASTPVK